MIKKFLFYYRIHDQKLFTVSFIHLKRSLIIYFYIFKGVIILIILFFNKCAERHHELEYSEAHDQAQSRFHGAPWEDPF